MKCLIGEEFSKVEQSKCVWQVNRKLSMTKSFLIRRHHHHLKRVVKGNRPVLFPKFPLIFQYKQIVDIHNLPIYVSSLHITAYSKNIWPPPTYKRFIGYLNWRRFFRITFYIMRCHDLSRFLWNSWNYTKTFHIRNCIIIFRFKTLTQTLISHTRMHSKPQENITLPTKSTSCIND